MRALSRDEKDMYIMGKLKCKSTGIDTSDKKRQRYMYSFDDREVCKVAFLLMHDLGEKQLKNLLKHLPFHFLTSKGWWVSSYVIVRNTGCPFQQCPMEMHLSKLQSYCQHPQLKLISILDINLFVRRAMKGITYKK